MSYHDVYLTPLTMYADASTVSNAAPAAPLTLTQLENAWVKAGGNAADAYTAARIAQLESGGVPNIVAATDSNGQGGTQASWGLWQISTGLHTAPIGWSSPATNAALAVAKFNAAGGFAGPWANSYAALGGTVSTAPNGSNFFDEVNGAVNAGENILSAIGQGIQNLPGTKMAENAIEALLMPLKFTAGAVLAVSNVLENLGPFTIGVLLLVVGGLMLAQAHRDELNAAVTSIAHTLEGGAEAAVAVGATIAAVAA